MPALILNASKSLLIIISAVILVVIQLAGGVSGGDCGKGNVALGVEADESLVLTEDEGDGHSTPSKAQSTDDMMVGKATTRPLSELYEDATVIKVVTSGSCKTKANEDAALEPSMDLFAVGFVVFEL